MVRGCLIAISLLIFLSPLGAQGLSGTISGVTKDASGGVVSGASVQIVNANTNVRAWTGSTSREGTFVAPMLNAGAYNVSIEAPGFKKFEILGLPLEVDQRARVDAVLRPGELKQTITVTGDTVALLNKEDSAHGLDVSPSELRDVPLASRDIFNLMNLAAGVSAGGDATAINDVQFSVNGSRTEASEVHIHTHAPLIVHSHFWRKTAAPASSRTRSPPRRGAVPSTALPLTFTATHPCRPSRSRHSECTTAGNIRSSAFPADCIQMGILTSGTSSGGVSIRSPYSRNCRAGPCAMASADVSNSGCRGATGRRQR